MEKSEAESKKDVANAKEEKKKKQPMSKAKKYTVISVCAVVLVGVAVFLGAWFTREGPTPEPEPIVERVVERVYVTERDRVPAGGRGIVVTEDNLDEIRERMRIAEQFGHFLTSMSTDWVFETALSPSINAYVENHESNPGTVFFDVVLDDEIIFSSPYIPLGERLDSITLDVELPPGEYRPTVTYHLLDENYQVQATLSVAVSLRILG